MRSVAQLEDELEWAEYDHTAAMGRLLAAEAKFDRARTAWGRAHTHRRVLACIEEVRVTEMVYRAARLDLALRRWEQAGEDARRFEGVARNAVDMGKGPAAVNAAFEARDNAVAAIVKAAAEVERWKPLR